MGRPSDASPEPAGFTASGLLDVWDRCVGARPVDASLTLLEAACPGRPREELAALAVGRRDALLLECRERTFGPTVELFTECPECGERLEFPLDTRDFRDDDGTPECSVPGARVAVVVDDLEIEARAPTVEDIAAVADCRSTEEARDRLIERCVVRARTGEREVSVDELPADAIAAAGERLSRLDPAADTRLSLDCPECGHAWLELLDAPSLLLSEVEAGVRRLAREVHDLASAYGWSADEILSMSPHRRALFLDLVLE